MNKFRILMLTLAAVTVSACSGPQISSRNATGPSIDRIAAQPAQIQAKAAKQNVFIPDVNIARITVNVPRTLYVSEKNTYYPSGDIVWRGDLYGDRYEQVQAILQQSSENVAAKLQGNRPVHMGITRNGQKFS